VKSAANCTDVETLTVLCTVQCDGQQRHRNFRYTAQWDVFTPCNWHIFWWYCL